MKPALVAALVVSLALPAVPARTAAPDPSAPADQEIVLGLSIRGVHRAYPAGLFTMRRVMNDVLGGLEIAVYHDPGRGRSAAWFRWVLGEPIEFSGAANGSVADDLTTVTRWDLMTGVAVGGNLQGQRLVGLPVTATSWASWRAAHPDAQVYSGRADE